MQNDYSSTFSSSVFILNLTCAVLNIILWFLALLLSGISLLTVLEVASTLYSTDGLQVTLMFGAVCLYAILIAIVHCHGVKISLTFGRKAGVNEGHFLKLVVPVWILSIIISMLIGVGIPWTLTSSAVSLKESVQSSLYQGMDQYQCDPIWQGEFDEMNRVLGCCGVTNYTDWQRVSWTVQPETKDAEVEAPAVPKSCYRPESRYRKSAPSECCKEAPDKTLEKIYTRGCFPVVADSLDIIVDLMRVIIVAIIILQLVLVLLTLLLLLGAKKDSPSSCYQPLSGINREGPAPTR